MGRNASGFAPPATAVGPTLQNGVDFGGARNYPWSKALGAGSPTAYFSNYNGPGTGNPIVPPVAALEGTTGWIGAGSTSDAAALQAPWGLHSPLVPILAGLAVVVYVMYQKGYKA